MSALAHARDVAIIIVAAAVTFAGLRHDGKRRTKPHR